MTLSIDPWGAFTPQTSFYWNVLLRYVFFDIIWRFILKNDNRADYVDSSDSLGQEQWLICADDIAILLGGEMHYEGLILGVQCQHQSEGPLVKALASGEAPTLIL